MLAQPTTADVCLQSWAAAKKAHSLTVSNVKVLRGKQHLSSINTAFKLASVVFFWLLACGGVSLTGDLSIIRRTSLPT